ncbi:hypothetical protein LT493_02420 [Streptomyces tricolor]|nr:hypothetical protein [Streptomyces tricolor]
MHPGTDLLTCTLVPASRVDAAPEPVPDVPAAPTTVTHDHAMAPLYRPIALAIALTDAVTARQVSEVVMQELPSPRSAGGGWPSTCSRTGICTSPGRRASRRASSRPSKASASMPTCPGWRPLTTGRPAVLRVHGADRGGLPGHRARRARGARAFLPLIASGRPVSSCILGFDCPRSSQHGGTYRSSPRSPG